MNTRPDDELLALWLEDELDPAESRDVETWIANREEWIAWRQETREWKHLLRQALPDEQKPPACEFFQARIGRIVRGSPDAAGAAVSAPAATSQSGRRRMPWLPLAAAAGMALCFWGGTHFGSPSTPLAPPAPLAASTPILYTPEQGVKALAFESEDARAMVIVLNGVAAIPDESEITARREPVKKPETGMADAAAHPKDRVQ